ncbi:MAG: V-type ATP synthase subunit E [Clostridiaceae bacterium]
MTNVDDKLKLFNKMVFEKIQEEKQIEIEEFEKEKEKQIKEELEKLELRKIEYINDMKKKAENKGVEIVAKETMNLNQKKFLIKDEFFKETMKEVRNRIEKFVEENDYKVYLFEEINKALDLIGDKECIVYLSEKDIKRYKDEIQNVISSKTGMEMEIKMVSYDILGGLIIEDKNGKYRINNTLVQKVKDVEEYAGLLLTQLMEQEV